MGLNGKAFDPPTVPPNHTRIDLPQAASEDQLGWPSSRIQLLGLFYLLKLRFKHSPA
jgi:hypothetical protein